MFNKPEERMNPLEMKSVRKIQLLHLEMKTTMSETKSTLDITKGRLDATEENSLDFKIQQ